jgi:hypothetical protein
MLDEGFISGTMTAHGLRRAGCEVDVVAAAGGHGSCTDRSGNWRLAPKVGDSRLWPIIDETVLFSSYDVVYPVTEPLQQLIWNHRPAWESFVFPEVDEAQRERRCDKWAMSEHMARSGVRIPDQRPAGCDAQVVVAIAALGLPVVIKGSWGRGGQATRICDTAAEACAAARELRLAGSKPFAQQFIRGTTCLAGGLFDRGRALRFFAGRKTVQYPPRTGPAAEILSDADVALEQAAIRVFEAANVTGLASIDFVCDDRGAYHFLELNPRPWGSIDAAHAAGVDLFEALVALWRSETIEADTSFVVGRRVPIFPLYLFSRPCWRDGHLAAAIRGDFAAAAAFAVHQPRQALHQLHRLLRVGLNWSQPLFHR